MKVAKSVAHSVYVTNGKKANPIGLCSATSKRIGERKMHYLRGLEGRYGVLTLALASWALSTRGAKRLIDGCNAMDFLERVL